MMERRLVVVNGLTGQETQVKVTEGATTADVLRQLGLENYRLARVRDRRVLDGQSDVSRAAENGERLFAFAPMVVGGRR